MKGKHLSSSDIQNYIHEKLPVEDEMNMGIHLAECQKCRENLRTERSRQMMEDWTAQKHGQLYWQTRISQNLEKARQETKKPALKKRLDEWINIRKSRLGGFVKVLLKEAKKEGDKIIDLSKSLPGFLLPYQFTEPVVVRGKEKDQQEIKMVTKGDPDIRIITNIEKKEVIVLIEQRTKRIPTIIIFPEIGTPVVKEAKRVKGTHFYKAVFRNLGRQNFHLGIEAEIE